MATNGITAGRKRKYAVTTDSKHNHPVAENVLSRRFAVESPNEVWASDITYIRTGEDWLYLSCVMDLCTRAVVGWSMDDSLESSLVTDALEMAYRRRHPAAGLLHHSDRGVQYAGAAFRRLLVPSCVNA